MRIEKINWENAGSLEELSMWGVQPLLTLCRLMDDYISKELEDDEGILYYHYLMRDGLERLDEALYRFQRTRDKQDQLPEKLDELVSLD